MSIHQTNLVYQCDVDDSWQSILLVLADQADDEGRNAFPSVPLIAWKIGMSERQVQRILQALVALEWVEQTAPGGGRVAAEYRLLLGNVPQKVPYAVYKEMTDREKSALIQHRKALKRDLMQRLNGASSDEEEEPRPSDEDVEALGQTTLSVVQGGAGQNVTAAPDEMSPPKTASPRQNVTAAVTQLRHPSGDIAMSPDPSFTRPVPLTAEAGREAPDGDGGSGGRGSPDETPTAGPPPAPAGSAKRIIAAAKREMQHDVRNAVASMDQREARGFVAEAAIHIAGEDRTAWVDPRPEGKGVELAPWHDRPRILRNAIAKLMKRERRDLRGCIVFALQQLYTPFPTRKAAPGTEGASVTREMPGANAARPSSNLAPIDLNPALMAEHAAAVRANAWLARNAEQAEAWRAEITEAVASDGEWKRLPRTGKLFQGEVERRLRARALEAADDEVIPGGMAAA